MINKFSNLIYTNLLANLPLFKSIPYLYIVFNKSLKSLKRVVYILAFLFLMQSCKKDIKPIIFETISIENPYEADIEVLYDKAQPNSDVAKTINTHIEKKIIEAIPNAENSNTIEEAVNAFEQSYLNFKDEFFDTERAWTLAVETELLYKTETLIALGLSVYADTGGAHGNDTIQFLNFNPETGSLHTTESLISDSNGFKKLAESFFLDHMKNEGTDSRQFFFGKPFQLPENIGFNDEGVILLYNTYEISSYNQGYTEFVIPMDKAKAFLNI